MHTYRLTVGPDGTLRIPDAQPGQFVTVVVEPEPSAAPEPEPLTLATAKTDFTVGDLYGDDGLPA